MYKVAVAGANGRMGQIVKLALSNTKNFSITASITSKDNIDEVLSQIRPDILIDVTRPEFAMKHAEIALKHAIKPIIGTSGIKDSDAKHLRAINNKVGGIIAPNFSISAILMLKFSEIARNFFSHAEIIEEHHPAKLDAPSGTAIKTAEILGTNNIYSIRRPGVIAKQTVLLANEYENLTITQESIARESFISGIIFACQQVLKINDIRYLEELISSKKTENIL